MKTKEFDYYIFIDYSENLIGYTLFQKEKIKEILPWIHKLKHYHSLKNRDLYLKAMKKLFVKEKIYDSLEKHKITELRQNVELCSEIFEFCKNKPNSRIFISVDDRQYLGFMKLMGLLDVTQFTIIKEGKLKKNSLEHKLSLIIDTLLNLKRTRK